MPIFWLSFFKKKKDIPTRTIIRTTKDWFNQWVFVVKIKDSELNVFRAVYERSDINFLIK